jgi:hypothetical protein
MRDLAPTPDDRAILPPTKLTTCDNQLHYVLVQEDVLEKRDVT